MKRTTLAMMAATLCLALGQSSAHAADSIPSTNSGFKLFNFRVSQFSAFQSGGNSFSAIADWMPTCRFNDSMAISLNAGYAPVKGKSGTISLLEAGALFSYSFTPNISAELGGGIQRLTDYGTNWMAQANAVYKLDTKLLWVIDHFAAGYSADFISGAMMHEIRAGVGIAF